MSKHSQTRDDNEKRKASLVLEILELKHGFLILDGAMGTQLERTTGSLDPDLWSAGALIDNPKAIRAVHRKYYESGADFATTASYQATLEGFAKKGIPEDAGISLLKDSVQLAIEARRQWWMALGPSSLHLDDEHRLVAASVGCYGASRADGSEYRGDYGLTKDQLITWHRPRMDVLAKAGADLLACETIPCKVELKAILDLVKAYIHEDPEFFCWVSVSCRDSLHLNNGDSLIDCAKLVEEADPILLSSSSTYSQEAEEVDQKASTQFTAPRCHFPTQHIAFGINCTAPQYVEESIKILRQHCPNRILVAYPNSGEVYEKKAWKEGTGVASADAFAELAEKWVKAGANFVGGCCRTNYQTIRAIKRRLRGKETP